ncbi:acyl carrier protein [Streptomyces sp. NRRL S-920]|uniref:acyl carrier protein n=1 Tax=Streptomyces sp. NRRL S-920 TaxID=1463921 RepID=UPI00131C1DE2|nr:phosphopantetheine-binding protein [Streptomyces sp. NRRL S-920]
MNSSVTPAAPAAPTTPDTPTPTLSTGTADLIAGLLVDHFQVSTAAIRADAPMTDLLADSLMVVEMAIALKDRFGVVATEDELRELTFAEFTARVDQRRAG